MRSRAKCTGSDQLTRARFGHQLSAFQHRILKLVQLSFVNLAGNRASYDTFARSVGDILPDLSLRQPVERRPSIQSRLGTACPSHHDVYALSRKLWSPTVSGNRAFVDPNRLGRGEGPHVGPLVEHFLVHFEVAFRGTANVLENVLEHLAAGKCFGCCHGSGSYEKRCTGEMEKSIVFASAAIIAYK